MPSTAAVRSSKESDVLSLSVGTLMHKSGPRRGESDGLVRLHVGVRGAVQLIPLGWVVAIFPLEVLLDF